MADRSTRCPNCGSLKVRHGSTPLRHWTRWLLRRRHRYCLSCKEKWHVSSVLPRAVLPQWSLILIAVGVIGGILACLIAQAPLSAPPRPRRQAGAVEESAPAADAEAVSDPEARWWNGVRDLLGLEKETRDHRAPAPSRRR